MSAAASGDDIAASAPAKIARRAVGQVTPGKSQRRKNI
jgi:hypothetical protein